MRRLLVLCSVLPLAVHAAELSVVPMQGAMVHINLGYSAATTQVTVHVDASIPALTPLLLSHPPDTFNTNDPWYASLDPEASGLAFNRQYGIVLDAASDTIPAGQGIWVRQLGATDGLQAYTYRSSGTNKVWQPMFGTAGSTNVLQWAFMMFHPAYAVPARIGSHEAAYEAFLVDTASGVPVEGALPAPFTLQWTSMGPDVQIAAAGDGSPVATWPACLTNFALEHATTPAGSWESVGLAPATNDGWCRVTVVAGEHGPFFRLQRPPAP